MTGLKHSAPTVKSTGLVIYYLGVEIEGLVQLRINLRCQREGPKVRVWGKIVGPFAASEC